MNTTLIDGAALSKRLRSELAVRVATRTANGRPRPGLAAILVGDSAASKVYLRNKTRACDEVGVHSELIELPAATAEAELLAQIAALNARADIHGILVQLPLPAHIAAQKVLEAIDPRKDVDGFHLHNVGALVTGHPVVAPCTPAGVMAMLEAEHINPWGRHAVIVGASNIVGKPMAMLLLQKGATVTICNSKTPDLGAMTRQADILVVATGKPNTVTGAMVKPGVVVIDVGINRNAEGKLVGDCDAASMQGIAAKITPVPGGVGPMTVTMLVANTVGAAERITDYVQT